ncbi:MAG: hypothetical protein P1U65_10515 [Minwuia sp.]|nr:hypothetical protein [Minwuia sp.]
MPMLFLRLSALLASVLVVAACQTPPELPPGTPSARMASAPAIPLADMATMRGGELSSRFARFDVAGHQVAMQLPAGFCEVDDNAPAWAAGFRRALDRDAFTISSLAMSCAVLQGRDRLSFPVAAILVGQMSDGSSPVVVDATLRKQYDQVLTILRPENGTGAARQLVLDAFIEGAERAGNSVEHLDAETVGDRIRGRVLFKEGDDKPTDNWVFMDVVIAMVGERLLGIGVVNVSRQPAPPDIAEDSEGLFATLRQVRN